MYIIGVFTIFIGQRSLQVITLIISKIYGKLITNSKKVSLCIGFLIIISPVIFSLNNFRNLSIGGGQFIQDTEMNSAGIFVDRFSLPNQIVFVIESPYPTGYTTHAKIWTERHDYDYLKPEKLFTLMDIIINSPKTKLFSEYLGLSVSEENIFQSEDLNLIYNNGFTSINSKTR